jgi:hypothetical protein
MSGRPFLRTPSTIEQRPVQPYTPPLVATDGSPLQGLIFKELVGHENVALALHLVPRGGAIMGVTKRGEESRTPGPGGSGLGKFGPARTIRR